MDTILAQPAPTIEPAYPPTAQQPPLEDHDTVDTALTDRLAPIHDAALYAKDPLAALKNEIDQLLRNIRNE